MMSQNLIQNVMTQVKVQEAQSENKESIANKQIPDKFKKEEPKKEETKEEVETREKEYKTSNPTPKREEGSKVEDKEPKEKEEVEEKEEKEEKKESTKKKIKYKVDDQEIEEEVDEQDLINNYSGQKAIQKRFTEFDKIKKSFEKEKAQIMDTHNKLDSYIGGIKSHFEKELGEFTKTGRISDNIHEPLFDMVDKLGLDAQQLDKALFYHYIPKVAEFLDMDDNGREAFFVKKENEWLKKKQNLIGERERQTQEMQTRLAEENSLKKQAGLTEESFAELREELVNRFQYPENELDAQKIVAWSKEKPSYDRAENLVKQAGKGDVFKVARLLVEFPDVTDEEILNSLGYKEKRKNELKEELKDKLPSKKPVISDRQKRLEEEALLKFKQFRR